MVPQAGRVNKSKSRENPQFTKKAQQYPATLFSLPLSIA
jgi:hypothetical protein